MTASTWLVTAGAALVCSWIVSPPVSTAGRAAWAALIMGFLAVASLVAFDHRVVLVLALPIAALAAPLAVIRRHRAGSQTQDIPAARGRVVVAMIGWLLFAFGVNVAALNEQSAWTTPVLMLAAALIAGILPIHRPTTETLRAAPADIRAPVLLMLGPGLWIALARWAPPSAWRETPATLPLLTLWLGGFLVLARGDLPRLVAATLLFASGQVATAAVFTTGSPGSVAGSLLAPLVLVALLVSKLERNAGTREVSELGGLARRMPRLSVALLAAVFWLLGTAALTAPRSLIESGLQDHQTASAWQAAREIWPIAIPQILALWGWCLVLRDLLVGPDRTPQFPGPLRERVTVPQVTPPVEDLTTKEFAAVIAFAALALVLSGTGFARAM